MLSVFGACGAAKAGAAAITGGSTECARQCCHPAGWLPFDTCASAGPLATPLKSACHSAGCTCRPVPKSCHLLWPPETPRLRWCGNGAAATGGSWRCDGVTAAASRAIGLPESARVASGGPWVPCLPHADWMKSWRSRASRKPSLKSQSWKSQEPPPPLSPLCCNTPWRQGP